ncbi:undecaprenyl-phosphate alpha-N-acetylglucosaminyl 1-phosphate transferase [Aliidiomarina halalkaliphila]|uniref:Undecaprenyl-phosphate alpha-N-acetylglucosaminyl 1-phosphate transferase n=1 Tax=Aliidiomarina halalkaliphila TaxID=2593535 RepID=A0A552X5A6_9GAMM|nr:undecaprenyl-phosphate alpha-N-acetylglucosaminyl 1-phosphate transferase [Aliidiomarina halalkaliphila]TRW50185.1 undecaprenyl-phosphate alpha-N-acetylglucosaminyl 1-phosphate transferase [Aliidiomarina halalkaliphila]
MDVLIVFLGTSLVSWLLLSACIPVAYRVGLLDKPCSRKRHQGDTPLIGGLALAGSLIIVWLCILQISLPMIAYLSAASLMVCIGVLDDRFDLSVRFRIIMQLISASVLVFWGGVEIVSLGNLFGLGEFKLGSFSGVFTLLAIMAAMNAYNMIDGIDGLLGGLSLVAFGGICLLAWHSGLQVPLILGLTFIFALIPYLLRNLQSHSSKLQKVFMGDAGSMFIGLSIVWLLGIITNPTLSNLYHLRFLEMPEFSQLTSVRPVAVLWLIAIPLMDMLGIMVRRIVKRQNPFKPDRDHLHHIFMRAGFTPRETLLMIFMVGCFLMLVGVALEYFNFPEPIVLLLYSVVFLLYFASLRYCWRLAKLMRKMKGILRVQFGKAS